MTDDSLETDTTHRSGAVQSKESSAVCPAVDVSRNVILECLSKNSKIFFKSQQIDDPDLTIEEKKSIAEKLLDESHQKFLSRFGRYLQTEHLNYFEMSPHIADNENDTKFLINDIRRNLENRKLNVRNRRFAAMKAMIQENNYFTEKEMMRREPYLYEQMVGQYLTDMEKYQRDIDEDNIDSENKAFSNVLLEGIENDIIEKLRKEQEQNDITDTDDVSQQSSSYSNCTTEQGFNENLFPRKPPEFRKQWGNFEDDEKSKTDGPSKPEKPQKYVTAEEKEILRKEFVEIMYSKFLDGDDVDFDYGDIDDNTDLDDLDQIAQDDEDKYFDGDDDDDNDDDMIIGIHERNDCTDTSEDELDVYMRQLDRNVKNSMNE